MKNWGIGVGLVAAMAMAGQAQAAALRNPWAWDCVERLIPPKPVAPFTPGEMKAVLNLINSHWRAEFQRRGWPYEAVRLRSVSAGGKTGCGRASPGAGPFYCVHDRTVYMDPQWFNQVRDAIGEPTAELLMLVLAHESGHHVQTLRGVDDRASAEALALFGEGLRADEYRHRRTEFQADCLAGVFLGQMHAEGRLNEEQLRRSVQGVIPMGDDFQSGLHRNRFKKGRRGYPHGTSSERLLWVSDGVSRRQIEACEPFVHAVL